jgi:lipopolysaccharide/colanic/teichoic acid biosynthesis glycosyltransferase
MRRLIDVVIASTMLVLTAPLIAVIAVLNWLTLRRVFFRQTRIGRGLRPFVIVKFQTMVTGAEMRGTITTFSDGRITPLGRVLRMLKLDELPQWWHVLRGEMSLVGPRPLTPNEVAAIPVEFARELLASPPGMTGLAAAFISEERILDETPDPRTAYFETVLPHKVAVELAYARRRTWATDLAIILLTPVSIVLPAIRRPVVARFAPGQPASPFDPEPSPS